MHETKTDVLVVGAGPVGMFTALVLARSGVQVTVIDQEAGPATQSYACTLHPRTLALFDRFGLNAEILGNGHRVERIAYFDQAECRAELDLAHVRMEFPFVAPSL